MLKLKQSAKLAVEKFLAVLVRIKLKRTKPTVIGITGSFGKTTTKEAVYEVLKRKWRVYRNLQSLNTEIGLLLAVLEQPSGFSSPFKWLKILFNACVNALIGRKYDFWVLEYGADKPGDIKHLVSIVKPHVGIITHISCVHSDNNQFKNKEDVFEEKKRLVTCLGREGIAILNANDEFLKKLNGKLDAQTFWFNQKSGIYADDLKNTHTGFSAIINREKQKIRAHFPVLGTFHIASFLPALLCGVLHGISLAEGIHALQNFKLPPGRMSIIPAKYGALILDSSYNASPETVKNALEVLKDFPAKRRIAVLGNMNELGNYAEKAHCEVAESIGNWLDMLVTVGDMAKVAAETALKNGFPAARIKILSSAREAGEFLMKNGITEGDVILFKGSQNKVRLERAVKILMAHPQDAKTLLCRQEPAWKNIE